MNELTKIQTNKILDKIKSDLSYGYKILGNYSDQNDIIRVWCRLRESKTNKLFAVVATSGRRFNNSGSILELQSFGLGKNYKLAFLLIDENIKETTITHTTTGTEYPLTDFISEFLQAQPDRDLTQERLLTEGYNPKDVEWINDSPPG